MAVPEPDPVEEITAPALPIAPAPPVVAPAPIVPAPVAPVAPAPAPSAPAVAVLAPVAPSAPAPIAAPAENAMPDALALERARLLEETERTRLVAKALAHLLIEKGVLSLEELQARIEKMKAKGPGSVA
jgi:hypothetical protein